MNKRDDKCEVINLGNDTYIIKGVNGIPSDKVPLNTKIDSRSITRIEKQLNLGWVVGPEVEIEELALKVAKIVKISNHSMA